MLAVRALLVGLGVAAVGFLLFAAVEAPGGLAPRKHSETLRTLADSGSSINSIASLREKLYGIDRSRTDAEERLAELVARHRNAAVAEAALPTQITELRERIPHLESELAVATKEVGEAEEDLADCNARLKTYRRKVGPRTEQETEWSYLASKVARGEPLARREASDWAGTPGDMQDHYLRYWRIRAKVAAEEQTLTHACEAAAETRAKIAKSLALAKSSLEKSERELTDSRRNVNETPALVQMARADVARLAESRRQVAAELEKAEAEKRRHDAWLAAEQQREKAAKAAEARRLAEAERQRKSNSASVTYTWTPNANGGLRNIPPVLRTLIFAEAAGVDTGLDLLPDDEMAPSGIVRDVLGSVEPPAVGVEIHADGMGVTTRRGNQALVERANGPSALYTRQGPWESVEYSHGVVGQRYFDDYRGVTQFDFVNPHVGVRSIGEQPYEGNDYGQGWSQQVPLW